MILSLVFLLATAFAQESPLEQLIQEAIYEANIAIVQKHLDVLEINGFSYNNYVNLVVDKISVSNFSTIALKGTPEVKQIDAENGTRYDFNFAIGLDFLRLHFAYQFSSAFLSSSGDVAVVNTGNAIRARGVVNTYKGDTPCNAVLKAVEIDCLGSLDVDFGRWGIWNWILGHLIRYGYGMGGNLFVPKINQIIANQVQTKVFQSSFSEAACAPFNF